MRDLVLVHSLGPILDHPDPVLCPVEVQNTLVMSNRDVNLMEARSVVVYHLAWLPAHSVRRVPTESPVVELAPVHRCEVAAAESVACESPLRREPWELVGVALRIHAQRRRALGAPIHLVGIAKIAAAVRNQNHLVGFLPTYQHCREEMLDAAQY